MSGIMPEALAREVKELVDTKEYRAAADIVNRLPVFPQSELILKIPERLLSLRRRVDRLQLEFARIPLKTYIRKAEGLLRLLEDNKMYYSSLWAGVAACYAFMWAGEPQRVLKLVSVLQRRIKGLQDPRLRFILTMLEGQAHGSLLRMERTLSCAERMKTMIRSVKDPYFFMGGLGGLYSLVGFFRESLNWTRRAVEGAAPGYKPQLYVNLAGFYTASGDYRMALASLKKGRLEEWGFRSRASMIRACAYLDQGNFGRAAAEAVETLARAEKEGVRRLLHPATLIQACCHQAAGEREESARILREVLPLLRKYRLMLEYHQRRMVIGDARISRGLLGFPSLYLVHLLQKSRQDAGASYYRSALKYAHARKLFGLFMRLVPFFPEPVIRLLGKGKDTGLPGSFLQMPVFHVDSPVYNVHLLGKLRVCRRGRVMARLDLRPKDSAFLIHLACNKSRAAELDSLYNNFWRGGKGPAGSLSHLLVRLRSLLGVPAHLMRMRSGQLRWEVFFTTDLELFYELLSRAAMYLQVREWELAKREYLRAFDLCRGAPFEGMYDDWSEDGRRAFLNKLESAVSGFAECCGKCGDKTALQRVRDRLNRKKLLPAEALEN
jgi:tetratricopeptide (TPR) repeat protein